MSRQVSLFGEPTSAEPYFKTPVTVYDRFVNKKWDENSQKFGRKKDFLAAVQKEWAEIKDKPDALEEFLTALPKQPKVPKVTGFFKSTRSIAAESFCTSLIHILSLCSFYYECPTRPK